MRIRVSNADGVSQNISEYKELDVPVLTFNSKAEFTAFAEDYAKQPIDTAKSLCEMQIIAMPEQCGILIKLHHLIGDAWTLSLLGNQLGSILNCETVEAFSYADYVEAEQAYMQSRRYEKDKAFFIEQFKKCDEVTYLSEKSSDDYSAGRKTFVIDKVQAKLITDYAANNETSGFTLFTTALAAYVSRIKMNAEKFYIGTAVLNRSTYKEKNTAGMFINTIPMLVEIDSNKSFAEILSAVEDSALACFRHQKFNYGDLLENLRSEFKFNEKLYDIMISYQNANITASGFESAWYHSGMQTESLQLHIDDRDNEGIFRIHYDYLTDKFTGHQIEVMHEHIFNLLFDAIANPTKKICQLNILSESEKNTLLYDFNNTSTKYDKSKCVHTLFEEQTAKTPDKTAVIAQDKTLTYSELNSQANQIAHSLIERGIKPNDIVAFMLPRKSYLLSALFGILKAGACYMPIDPDYPQDRIDYMLDDSKARLCITEDTVSDYLNNPNKNNPNITVSSESNYCIIYTSGSTGKPKGCFLKHKGITNFCVNSNVLQYFRKINTEPIGISINNVTFDYFIAENIVLLLGGFKTVLCSKEDSVSPKAFWDLCQKHNVNLLQTTPTRYNILLQKEYIPNNVDIKLAVSSGESLTSELLSQLKQCLNVTVFNPLGPSECSVWVPNGEIEEASMAYMGVHTLFEEQVDKTPDKTAVIAQDKTLTYSELNSQANQIAHSLIEKGVKPNDIVAILLPRKSYLISAMFGVLKSGAAYMPVDPDYPQDRIDYMLSESKAACCITEENIEELLSFDNNTNPNINLSSNNLFCALHTSGSTGKPKMTLLTHKNLANFINWSPSYFKGVDICVTATIMTFDAFIYDTIVPLSIGLPVFICSNDEIYNQTEFEKVFEKFDNISFNSTPTKLKNYIDNSKSKKFLSHTAKIICGGEVFTAELYNAIRPYTKGKIYNGYGPVETTIIVTANKIN